MKNFTMLPESPSVKGQRRPKIGFARTVTTDTESCCGSAEFFGLTGQKD